MSGLEKAGVKKLKRADVWDKLSSTLFFKIKERS